MTYLQFHVAYTLPVLIGLLLVQPRPVGGLGWRPVAKALGLVVALALAYTTPWDNYLVYRDVWGYPPSAVLGTIGYVPIEEYAFFVIETLIAGLFYVALRGARWLPTLPSPMPAVFKRSLIVVPLLLTAVGVGMLLHPSDHALYMGLILAWAPPVVAGMAWVEADKVWNDRRRVLAAVTVPTLYLWGIDRTAIERGIWDIRDAYSLQIDPLGLPVEEAAFFVVTVTLCVMGLALFLPDPPATAS